MPYASTKFFGGGVFFRSNPLIDEKTLILISSLTKQCQRGLPVLYFQDVVATLSAFWAKHGCIITTPYDVEKGAGTSNPDTLLRSLGPEPFSVAYIEPCRRPKDGRYGTNPSLSPNLLTSESQRR